MSSKSKSGSAASVNQALLETMQYATDYFLHYNKGRRYAGFEERQEVFQNFVLPRNSSPRPDPAFKAERQPRRTHKNRVPMWRHRRTDDGAGREVADFVRARMEAQGFTVGRILGAGSQGGEEDGAEVCVGDRGDCDRDVGWDEDGWGAAHCTGE